MFEEIQGYSETCRNGGKNIENRKINFGLALKQIKGNKVVNPLIE